jgi:cytochrome c-type biogenesis protein
VSAIVVWSLLSASQVSYALQHGLNVVLGPLLILTGLVMLGWISLPFSSTRRLEKLTERAGELGLWGAALLGMIFALTFCPVSAALFFGSLIPIGVQANSTFIIPSVYAVGTALPVLLFAILLALGVRSLSGVFNWLTRAERWARWGTAVVFILIGLHLSLVHLVGVDVTEPLWRT